MIGKLTGITGGAFSTCSSNWFRETLREAKSSRTPSIIESKTLIRMDQFRDLVFANRLVDGAHSGNSSFFWNLCRLQAPTRR